MSGTKILVVDDDVELRDLLREYLSQQGFAVSVLHDGDGLAARLERERPALVVLTLAFGGYVVYDLVAGRTISSQAAGR